VDSHGLSVPEAALPFGPRFPLPCFFLFLLDQWEVSTLSGWVFPPLRVALSLRLPEGLRLLPHPLPPGHWPALQQVESAGPTTHGAYRVPPAGESNALGSPSAPVGLCPVDGQTTELPILPTYHFGSGLSAVLARSTSRGLRVFTMLPLALFLSPGVRVRLPDAGTFLHASHLPVTRDARCR
jgi:hypothetical protein